jgi:hypothetical protein
MGMLDGDTGVGRVRRRTAATVGSVVFFIKGHPLSRSARAGARAVRVCACRLSGL